MPGPTSNLTQIAAFLSSDSKGWETIIIMILKCRSRYWIGFRNAWICKFFSEISCNELFWGVKTPTKEVIFLSEVAVGWLRVNVSNGWAGL
jgi:hypothetical protein